MFKSASILADACAAFRAGDLVEAGNLFSASMAEPDSEDLVRALREASAEEAQPAVAVEAPTADVSQTQDSAAAVEDEDAEADVQGEARADEGTAESSEPPETDAYEDAVLEVGKVKVKL